MKIEIVFNVKNAMNKSSVALSTIVLLCSALTANAPISVAAESTAATFKIGTQESSNYMDAEVVDSPRPEIPSELYEQGLKSSCVARFSIRDTGKFSVKLVSSSGSQEIDDIALKTLQLWKFKPATVDGKPIESSRKIRVEFEFD